MHYNPSVLEAFNSVEHIMRDVNKDRKSTRLNSSHSQISYAVFCLKKKKLAQAGELVREKHYDDAATTLDPLIASDPHNPALHFLMGYIRQQQENWDRAFDEYSTSRDELPGSSDTHSRLAYVFYRYDDADKAVAEARTALSIDPTNAEAYRYLGLGLYASHKDAGALHAFEESLAREPKRAEVYYDIAILRDKGD